MLRPGLVLVCPLLVAFAPVPPVRPMTDPDQAIQQFDRNARTARSGGEKSFADRKERLIERLRELQTSLSQRGLNTDAGAVHDRVVLLQSVDGDRPLGPAKAATLIQKASVDGKYRHLLHAIYVPADQVTYSSFQDFGFWNGAFYGGQSNLQAGHWVYVHPRWFIWRDGPTPPQVNQP